MDQGIGPLFECYSNAPLRSVPSCAYPPGDVLARFDWNSNPISLPENEPTDTAGAISPRNEPGSVGATPVPIPRETGGPLASHSARKSTSAGVLLGPKNWNVSITGTFFT